MLIDLAVAGGHGKLNKILSPGLAGCGIFKACKCPLFSQKIQVGSGPMPTC